MDYNDYELKKLQEIETKMLADVLKFCEKNQIDFFIIGGTALGAVRHKGFIPWDDDIDIGMTRENYNKFIKLGIAEWNKGGSTYFLQCSETEKNCPYIYTKLRLNDTIFSEYCNRNVTMHQGIYIDIFPYDNMPDEKEEYISWFNKLQKLIKLYVMTKTPDITKKPDTFYLKIKSLLRRIIFIFLKFLPSDLILRNINNLALKYNFKETRAITCICFPKIYCGYCKIEELFPLKLYDFNGLKIPGPNNIDNYLKNHYGNYMKLPPEQERIGHKPYKLKF